MFDLRKLVAASLQEIEILGCHEPENLFAWKDLRSSEHFPGNTEKSNLNVQPDSLFKSINLQHLVQLVTIASRYKGTSGKGY